MVVAKPLQGKAPFKTVLSILTLAVSLAFIVPAFAQDAKDQKTQEDCLKVGGVWDSQTKTCKQP
jgi:hypothetical protein